MSETVREFLVRGIAAAKSNDPKDIDEARYYLKRAINAKTPTSINKRKPGCGSANSKTTR